MKLYVEVEALGLSNSRSAAFCRRSVDFSRGLV